MIAEVEIVRAYRCGIIIHTKNTFKFTTKPLVCKPQSKATGPCKQIDKPVFVLR